MTVGHPKVTARAYEQYDKLQAAVQFATATVVNGLGKDAGLLSPAAIKRLTAQVERDFLVATMAAGEE